MIKFTSKLITSSRLMPGIHGMRGLAALAIVVFHTVAIVGTNLPEFLSFVGKYFGYSVHLFFVLSAFSLMYSTLPTIRQYSWAQNYLIKRFFRIAPLFYFIGFVMILWRYFSHSPFPDVPEILANVTFTFGLMPPYTGGLVWASWAIGAEVLFYAIFPVLLMLVTNLRSSSIFLAFAILTSFALRSILHHQFLSSTPAPRYDPSYFFFGSNGLFFAFGIWAFYLRDHIKQSESLLRIARLSALALLAGLLFFNLASCIQIYARVDLLAWGLAFALLCVVESLKPSILMANCVMEYFGERSFSIYLVHPFALFLAKPSFEAFRGPALPLAGSTLTAFAELIAAVALILPLAEATYRLIEVPGINLGKALIKKMGQKRECDQFQR